MISSSEKNEVQLIKSKEAKKKKKEKRGNWKHTRGLGVKGFEGDVERVYVLLIQVLFVYGSCLLHTSYREREKTSGIK